MDIFATRSALIGLWITIGAIGLVLLVTGIIQIWGSLLLIKSIGNAFGMSWALVLSGTIIGIIGGAITWFCALRIIKDLRRPILSGKNARAPTPALRQLAIIIFLIGTTVGGYGLVKLSQPLMQTVTELTTLVTVPATVVKLDTKLADDGSKSGEFKYYAKDTTQKYYGNFEGRYKNVSIGTGYSFSITYNRKDPAQYYLNKPRPNPLYLLPETLSLIFVFWMIAAGITGVKANMDSGDEDEFYGENESYNDQKSYKSNSMQNGRPSFGKYRG